MQIKHKIIILLGSKLLSAQAQAPASENGEAVVVNKCNFPVYYVSVGDTFTQVEGLQPNAVYREVYQLRSFVNVSTQQVEYGGKSIMLSPNQSIGLAEDQSLAFQKSTITQFEYTYNPSKFPGLWYDISNVNGYVYNNTDGWDGTNPWPFQAYGLEVLGTGNCSAISCPGNNPGGNSTCVQAYTHPADDFATHSCSNNNSIVLSLCVSSFLDNIQQIHDTGPSPSCTC
jgi:hypothetical protein